MRLDWMILANYVEVRDGMITIVSGAWDRTSATGPLSSHVPGGPVAMINGGIAIRLLADEGELAESHEFEITIGLYDEEEPLHRIGGLVAGQPGGAEVVLPGLGVPLIVHLNIAGIPLPSVGWYSVRLFVDGARLGQVPFRVVEDLSPPGPGSV